MEGSELDIFPENLPGISYKELYEKTWDQIAKDFHPYISLEKRPDTLGPQALFDATRDLLTKIMKDSPSDLQAILYRIDLKESQKSNHIEQLTYFIVRREAQKVWLRKSFS
ncbi:MAG: hypothetical protein R2809_05040 [Flavobacteriales bacterium]